MVSVYHFICGVLRHGLASFHFEWWGIFRSNVCSDLLLLIVMIRIDYQSRNTKLWCVGVINLINAVDG